jgi:hypothetical protein
MRASKQRRGKLFVSAYDNNRPRPAVHKEKLGHALSLNECSRWFNMLCCEVIHDGEIFSESRGPDHALACISGMKQ